MYAYACMYVYVCNADSIMYVVTIVNNCHLKFAHGQIGSHVLTTLYALSAKVSSRLMPTYIRTYFRFRWTNQHDSENISKMTKLGKEKKIPTVAKFCIGGAAG